ncbi:MAG TPA: PHP-associated domain-containing protein [Candidatus Limnocylindrales bacterium]|nr:PHP-associated domain-containing protein [Candidatus Limnocylindrales bacterium]
MSPDGSARLGRADLHIHTLASDGTASVAQVLDAVAVAGSLDVIAIADHERIDAAVAARHLARDRGLSFEVVVGEEITTRGGHLLGLFLEQRVPPLKSLRWSIEAVHDQGGIAVPAHPLVPLHLSAQGWVLRGLLGDDNPLVHPDALETFNPTAIGRYGHRRAVAFAAAHGLPRIGSSDAHALEAIGTAWTDFPGRSADDLRRAILAGDTTHDGTFHGSAGQVGVFGRQLRKRGRDARAELAGRLRRDGSGRDHGYPGSTRRPPLFDPLDGPRQ